MALLTRIQHWLRRFNWLGIVGSVAGLWAAMTPSLLPRPTLFEGIIAGLGAAIGYGLGVGVASGLGWMLRNTELSFRMPWQLLVITACAIFSPR